MKKLKMTLLLMVSVLAVLAVAGCKKEPAFEALADAEVFQTVPKMVGEKVSFTEPLDVGDDNYMVWTDDTTQEEYRAYLTELEKNGFKKYLDNGDIFKGNVYTVHYMKEEVLVVVTYFPHLKRTMITACQEEDKKLSDHLFYKDEYLAGNKEGAKTSLTLMEMYSAGNSFVIQLKNGHFIVEDGGYEQDLPYLLDYLESLTPEGEKPVIEAWIVSHPHPDHVQVMIPFTDDPSLCNRIYMEGIYMTTPLTEQLESDNTMSYLVTYVRAMGGLLKNEKGGKAQIYRMRTGERYYFNDITMDVIYTQELLERSKWKTDNATSTVQMFTIEGQTVLITADTDWENQVLMMKMYDGDFFDLDVYQAPHHGGNVYNPFTRFLKRVGTVLWPSEFGERRPVSQLQGRYTQSLVLNEKAEESLCWRNGGIVLEFPYTPGTYKTLPLIDWKYSETPAERHDYLLPVIEPR